MQVQEQIEFQGLAQQSHCLPYQHSRPNSSYVRLMQIRNGKMEHCNFVLKYHASLDVEVDIEPQSSSS
jgi:hypothetical protein